MMRNGQGRPPGMNDDQQILCTQIPSSYFDVQLDYDQSRSL